MGNVISFNDIVSADDDSLAMSNGLTDVLVDYLLISGSRLAETESEKRMVVFLAEKQQSIVGGGTVGFDIVEMPWQIKTFEADKDFMLVVTEYAQKLLQRGSLCDMLGYSPDKESLQTVLNGFEALIRRMTVNDVDENNLNEWLSSADQTDPVNCGYPQCPKHNVLLSVFGCKLCNDGV